MTSSIKERPILFKGAMVCAILSGIKTQTRRTNGLEFINENPGCWQRQWVPAKDGKHWLFTCSEDRVQVRCPYGVEGERLWVRETLFWSEHEDGWCYQAGNDMVECEYSEAPILLKPLKSVIPSIHMPRVASRILLEIVSVRVERLQDISREDAIAEGVEEHGNTNWWKDYECDDSLVDDPEASYETLWVSINGPDSWQANPWVWVVEFKRVEQ